MNREQTYISAPPGELYWRKGPCPVASAKVLLLTIGGIAVVGQWYGAPGASFTHWCPLPKHGAPTPPVTSLPLLQRLQFAFNLIFNPERIK